MNESAMTVIFTTDRESDAQIMQAMLEQEGVESSIEGAHQAGLTGVIEVKLLVRNKDAARAKQLIDKQRPM